MQQPQQDPNIQPAPKPYSEIPAPERPMSAAVIQDVIWHRTHMLLVLSNAEGAQPVLFCNTRQLVRPLQEGTVEGFNEDIPEGCRVFKMNFANGQVRGLLPSGIWQLNDGEQLTQYQVAPTVMRKLEDLNRSFYFGKGELYGIRFNVPQDDAQPPRLELQVNYFKRNGKPGMPLSKKKVLFAGMNGLYHLFRAGAKKDGKHVLFMSENNERMMGNLAAIHQRLQERGLDSEFAVDYSFRNIFKQGGAAKVGDTVKVLKKMAQADYIFVEDYTPILNSVNFPPEVEITQVWHAGYGFKLVGFGRFGISGSPNPYAAGHRKYTHALVGNSHLKEIYAEVFGIPESCMLPTGMPRLEHFLDAEVRTEAEREFEERFPQAAGKHVVLFAPTYRGKDQESAHYSFDQLDFDALAKFCEATNSVVLFKMHRFIEEPVPIPPQYADIMMDASGGDINRLYYKADVLVTDYSSCFYDYLLLGRPVVFFPYDLDYYAATRGIHRPVEDVAPGAVCMNSAELVEKLTEMVQHPETQQLSPMLVDRNSQSSKLASDRVIDYLLLGDKTAMD